MTRSRIDDLKSRQIAFFQARLGSAAAERQWRESLPALWAALLAMPLRDVAGAASVARALDAMLAPEAARAASRPLAQALLAELSAAARREKTRGGDYVPAEARAKLDRLLERPKLVPERLVREVLASDAVDEVMRDVLYTALTEFSDKVNPFFADWGLPALLKKLTPFGFGGVSKSAAGVRAEFEKRLEPEIRKFLQGFSRKSMRELTEIVIAKGDSPKFLELRKHVVGWLLAQEIGALARTLDEEGAALAQAVAVDVVGCALEDEALAARRRAAIEAFFAAHGGEPIERILKGLGVRLAPDFDVIAEATWPLVRSLYASAPAQAWIASLVAEFFDGLPEDAI